MVDTNEFNLNQTFYQGNHYLSFVDMSFQKWKRLKLAQLHSKLKLVYLSISNQPAVKIINLGKKRKTTYHKICTWRDLQNIKEKLDGNYILKNDIVFPLPGTDGFSTNGFGPVGTSTNPFTGRLNGDFKTIINLYIDHSKQDDVGLLGVISNNPPAA